MRSALFLAAVLTAAASGLKAQEFKPITGQYGIASKTILDPPPGEKKDRVLLFIHGSGARDVYEAMPGRGRNDACGGGLLKSAGGLACSKSTDGNYQCSLGVLLATGATVQGSVC
jgi:hypothetical protein